MRRARPRRRITLRAGREAAIYLLNKKRAELAEIEERYGVSSRSRSTKVSRAPG